jgi:hypothetical protein
VSLNEFFDPGFESGALWRDRQIAAATVTDYTRVVSDPAISGTYSLRVECSANGSGDGELVLVGWDYVTVNDVEWSAACIAGYAPAHLRGRLSIVAFSGGAGGTELAREDAVTEYGEIAPTELHVDGFLTPSGTDTVEIQCAIETDEAATIGGVSFDNLTIVKDAETAEPQPGGESAGYAWAGPAYGSASQEVPEADRLPELMGWVPLTHYSTDGAL